MLAPTRLVVPDLRRIQHILGDAATSMSRLSIAATTPTIATPTIKNITTNILSSTIRFPDIYSSPLLFFKILKLALQTSILPWSLLSSTVRTCSVRDLSLGIQMTNFCFVIFQQVEIAPFCQLRRLYWWRNSQHLFFENLITLQKQY